MENGQRTKYSSQYEAKYNRSHISTRDAQIINIIIIDEYREHTRDTQVETHVHHTLQVRDETMAVAFALARFRFSLP